MKPSRNGSNEPPESNIGDIVASIEAAIQIELDRISHHQAAVERLRGALQQLKGQRTTAATSSHRSAAPASDLPQHSSSERARRTPRAAPKAQGPQHKLLAELIGQHVDGLTREAMREAAAQSALGHITRSQMSVLINRARKAGLIEQQGKDRWVRVYSGPPPSSSSSSG